VVADSVGAEVVAVAVAVEAASLEMAEKAQNARQMQRRESA
jgi:hypothetical protein